MSEFVVLGNSLREETVLAYIEVETEKERKLKNTMQKAHHLKQRYRIPMIGNILQVEHFDECFANSLD